MASCAANDLAAAAKGFAGLTESDLMAIRTYLLCQYATASATYKADAVHFDDGVYLQQVNNGASANSKFTGSIWVLVPVAVTFPSWSFLDAYSDALTQESYPFDLAPNQNTDIISDCSSIGSTSYLDIGGLDGTFTHGVWHHWAISMDVNHSQGNKIGFLAFDGVVLDPSASPKSGDVGIAFQFLWQNFIIGAPAHNQPGFYSGQSFDMADFQLWIGTAVDLSVPSNLAKFISGGKPVDPSTAAAAFGTQTILFSGDTSTFPVSQGSGGAFTLTGALSDAATSPSD